MTSCCFPRIILLILLCIVCIASTCVNAVHVEIINDLESKADLVVHCKSKEDDLHARTLAFGQKFSFEFGVSAIIFRNTLFFCGVTIVNDPVLHWFDAFDQERDHEFNRVWKLRKDGACLQNQSKKFYDTDKASPEACLKWN